MECSLLSNGLFFYPDEDNKAQNKPCCQFGSNIPKERNAKVVEQLSLITINDTGNFYDDPFRKLNIKLLNKNAKTESCNTCWQHESLDYPSLRTRANKLKIGDNSKKLKYLELNTGNTCNIQCIMCNPSDSFKTKQYWEYAHNQFPHVLDKKSKNLYPKRRGLKKSDVDLIDWNNFKDLEYLKCTGGETYYTKEFWYFLEKLIEHDISKNIILHAVTNNTVELDNNKLDIFKKFKGIKIFSSVDGIGNLCDTIRAGSKWNEVEQNIKHLIELHKEYPEQFFHTEPHSVVQFANILQLDEIVDWWESVAITEEYKNEKHYLRLLHQPKWFEANVIPDSVKELAYSKYKNYKKLNHVVKFLKSSETKEDYVFKYTLPIFEESCRMNMQDPFSSEAYEVIKNA